MDKKHNLVIAACAVALLLVVGISAGVYAHYKYQQKAKVVYAEQVSAAKTKAQLLAQNQAQNLIKSQLQITMARLDKVYKECLVEAKKNKASNPGAVCAN